MRKSVQFAIVLLVLVGTVAWAEENEETPTPTISVTGTSVTRVAPDVIAWHINVLDESKDMALAKKSNDGKMKVLMAVVAELGVKPEHVMTSQLSIRKEYEQDQRGRRLGFKHWVVSRRVTLRQHDLDRFDEYFGKLASAGDMEMSYSLESTDIHALRWDNRQKAVRLAKEKAEAMLEVLGAKLGKPMKVDEHGPQSPYGIGSNAVSNNASFTMGNAPDDAINGTFAPGAIEVRNTVYVTFEIW